MKFDEGNKGVLTVPKYEECFVYFLLKNGEVIYVGQTRHGLARPLSHRDKEFDEIKIIYCDYAELDFLEDKYIRKYRPIHNKQNNRALRMGLVRVRDSIREQKGYSKYTLPRLRKLLKSLNIQTETDYYNGKETISFDDYKTVMEYIGSGENGS